MELNLFFFCRLTWCEMTGRHPTGIVGAVAKRHLNYQTYLTNPLNLPLGVV